MKIGIIGHEQTIENIETYLDNFETIYTESIVFNNESQKKSVETYLKTEEEKFDGFIFTGKIPFMLINQLMISKTPWIYLEYDLSSFLKTLFHASYHLNYSLEKVSIDSFDINSVKSTYEDLNIAFDINNIKIANFDLHDEHLLDFVTEFHKENYWNHGSKFCITGITEVYNRLTALQIPVVRLQVSKENISKAIQMLQLKTELAKTEMRQIVVVDIIIDPSTDIIEDEYHKLLQHNQVSREIYQFAQETQSAITEDGKEHYMLFCTKNTIELATDNYNYFPLIDQVHRTTNSTLSVGIGYGITVREAKLAAEKARRKARSSGGNQSYVVKYNEVLGPINSTNPKVKRKPSLSNYQQIARKSGISVDNIFKIHNAVLMLGKSTYSSREIAEQSGVSLRNMNRLIEKLEKAGYVEFYGKKILGQSGRPSRIIKIKFSLKK